MRALAAAAVACAALAVAATPATAGRATSPTPICDHAGDEPPVVDLYTFGVGPLVFEKFGHAMLCLTYADTPTICFNYGITDFSHPDQLVWGFMRSKQKFWVDGESLRSMLAFYGSERADDFVELPDHLGPMGACLLAAPGDDDCMHHQGYGEDRDIWRQRLPLAPAQAIAVRDKLCHDVEPANRYYIYHHFKDNCTTRLRDLLDTIFDGKLRDGAGVAYPITFRQFGRRGLNEYTALLGLSDFVTGRALDRYPSHWEAMFHPDVLRTAVADKLGIPAERIYARKGPPFPTSGPSGRPWVILFSVLFTLPLALARWRGRFERTATVIAVVPVILMTALIWSIFFLVSIDWIRWNEAMFLFVPTDVALLFLGATRRRQYARIRVGMIAAVSALCVVGVFKQPLWVPALTLFLPMALLAFDLPPRRSGPAPVPTGSTPAA
ncbi:MAG: DUF4105 domain-containing protein [Kofleriaceae bacterium]|nr:DUF4105 domain-containing protein [Kofleriaceae bacterium]MCB9571646.1 DUF4105 domain-containing protein [Kofleriaceae bacterium]